MKLTKRSIDGIQYQGGDDVRDVRWDGSVPGLGLRIYPSGRKAFVLSYRVSNRKRLLTLGTYGALTLDQARTKAQKLLGGLGEWNDPSEQHRTVRDAPMMAQLCDDHLTDYTKDRKKASSLRQDQDKIAREIEVGVGTVQRISDAMWKANRSERQVQLR